jgi:hypothetical protein
MLSLRIQCDGQIESGENIIFYVPFLIQKAHPKFELPQKLGCPVYILQDSKTTRGSKVESIYDPFLTESKP